MAGTNRSALIGKLYKVLKQHYKPVLVNGERPLLEQMLFACCLENAHYSKAEKTYEHLSSSFFDWNEVRVSTVKELAEAMRDLPHPAGAASNLKSVLQNVFEATYSFDLETVKKQNIGVGIKRLTKMEGASPFVVAYVTQHVLGGHSIPLDRGALEVLFIVGLATEAEKQSANVSGLERAIPKNKGEEFASLLHQLGADFIANPQSPAIKSLLLNVNAEAKDRLPKRGQKIVFEQPPAPAPVHGTAAIEKIDAKASKAAAEKAAKGKHRGPAGPPEKHGKKEAAKEAKKSHDGKAMAAESAQKKSLKKPPPAKAGRGHASTPSRPAAKSKAHKSATKHLAKRKPR
jgi:endonuclease III